MNIKISISNRRAAQLVIAGAIVGYYSTLYIALMRHHRAERKRIDNETEAYIRASKIAVERVKAKIVAGWFTTYQQIEDAYRVETMLILEEMA